MRRIDSYVKKYGVEKGTEILRRMQRMSGLASAHARAMKKLRQTP